MSINLLPNKSSQIDKKILLMFAVFLILSLSFIYQIHLRSKIKHQQRTITSLYHQNKLLHTSSSIPHDNKKIISHEKSQIFLKNELFTLKYARANDIAALLQNKTQHLISEQGTILADIRTNALWIKDAPENLTAIHQLIQGFDIPVPQILITAKIVNIDENFIQDLGVKWGMAQLQVPSSEMMRDFPSAELELGHISLALAKTEGRLLEMELHALESEGHANVISHPKLLTENRQTATIESGQEVPYQEQTSSGATNTAFKKAVLSLKVTPEIMTANKILLTLNVNQDKISTLSVNGVPAIDTEQLSTQVEVENNQTIILGGIYQEDIHTTTEQIPILSKIPGIGPLFQNKGSTRKKRELLIFVTPSILENKYSEK